MLYTELQWILYARINKYVNTPWMECQAITTTIPEHTIKSTQYAYQHVLGSKQVEPKRNTMNSTPPIKLSAGNMTHCATEYIDMFYKICGSNASSLTVKTAALIMR